jgi:hypothetical protein
MLKGDNFSFNNCFDAAARRGSASAQHVATGTLTTCEVPHVITTPVVGDPGAATSDHL